METDINHRLAEIYYTRYLAASGNPQLKPFEDLLESHKDHISAGCLAVYNEAPRAPLSEPPSSRVGAFMSGVVVSALVMLALFYGFGVIHI